jgi:hypothetical protein
MAAFQSARFPQADGGIDAQVEGEPPWGFVTRRIPFIRTLVAAVEVGIRVHTQKGCRHVHVVKPSDPPTPQPLSIHSTRQPPEVAQHRQSPSLL